MMRFSRALDVVGGVSGWKRGRFSWEGGRFVILEAVERVRLEGREGKGRERKGPAGSPPSLV